MPTIKKMFNWECLNYVTENPDSLCAPSGHQMFPAKTWGAIYWTDHLIWEVQEPDKEVTVTKERLREVWCSDFESACKELGL